MSRRPVAGGAGRDWREGGRRQGRGRQGGRDPERLTPPMMSRSRAQLATTYAPGVLFTWEGAKGICRSVPFSKELHNISAATRELIFEGIKEVAQNWLLRARAIRNPGETPIQLILDEPFYNPRSEQVEINAHRHFQLNDPGTMGYVPYPLLYRCAVCGHLREYDSIEEQVRHPLPRTCHGHTARWTQVDVVYVHWSGRLEPLSPYRWHYSAAQGRTDRMTQCECRSRDFRLDNSASAFSDWKFVCEQCGRRRDLRQPDPETWEVLESARAQGGRQYEWIEINMMPVSYRANAAFYPQRGQFIEFHDSSVVDLLTPTRQGDLLRRVAAIHGFTYTEPDDQEIAQALQQANRGSEWEDYSDRGELQERARARGDANRVQVLQRERDELRERWYVDGIIQRGSVQSGALRTAVSDRAAWARRYEPLRLTIEHDRFVIEHIEERQAHHESVDVLAPDQMIFDGVNDPESMRRYRDTIGGLMARIGVVRLHLIRGLPICEYSFGYTRVSASPVYQREYNGVNHPMPVKLKAFPELPNANGKRPVYVTQQKNEALYFRLDATRVVRWLAANNVPGVPLAGEQRIGAAYLEAYQDFGPFLDDYKDRAGVDVARDIPSYTYMLLHTLSHQVMHALADVSGLDRDGLGEYIFPADLAFVVYRKGMTPDLGNISAMWRNHAADFLRRMLDQRLLRCGSGSLCDTRGGACPACIMVSEVTCSAGNQLLSRSVLKGGAAPSWEPRTSAPLVGYFDPRVAQ